MKVDLCAPGAPKARKSGCLCVNMRFCALMPRGALLGNTLNPYDSFVDSLCCYTLLTLLVCRPTRVNTVHFEIKLPYYRSIQSISKLPYYRSNDRLGSSPFHLLLITCVHKLCTTRGIANSIGCAGGMPFLGIIKHFSYVETSGVR